jgi:CheY-like chemotaxis protein
MIYLIDDKKTRQESYGWNSEKFAKYSNFIKPIYTYSQIQDENLSAEIFKDDNTVLFHESFFDNSVNSVGKESVTIRKKLDSFTQEKTNFLTAFFSGSKTIKKQNKNIIHLPVSSLYQNLEIFINKVKQGNNNFQFLLFGANPQIEELLNTRLDEANTKIDVLEKEEPFSKNLFIIPEDKNIFKPLNHFTEKTIFDDEIEDLDLSKKTIEWLSDVDYDNIFIPICFGETLSDFNGLKLATHFRCTNTPNQIKNIFIYSFVDFSYLMDNEYFDILKTKNVYLIEHKRKAFKEAILSKRELLTLSELPLELTKMNLAIPKNYEDSHSISNEWAINRWANTLNVSDIGITKIKEKVQHSLYFKYLCTINPVDQIIKISENELKISSNRNPKILYIDDEADKGWYEIFCNIFYDINNFDFSYLCEELAQKTQDEIIDLSIQKIQNEDIDLVLLDFRLHPNDFNSSKIDNVTGLMLLQEIKKYNPGIQVIIFSATNKVWNLQKLLEAGADDFILKESIETNPYQSKESIINFVESCKICFERAFLKDFYLKLEKLKIELLPRKKNKTAISPLPKEFVDETLKWLELSYLLLSQEVSEKNITASYIFLFSVLENLSNRIIDIDNPISIPNNHSLYKFEFRIDRRRLRRFIEDNNKLGFYRRTNTVLESKRNLPWHYKILNTLDFISDESISEDLLSVLIKKRNDLIHANSTTGDKIRISTELLIQLNDIIYTGLMNVK